MSFEVNQGQVDPRIAFVARGVGYSLFLSQTDTVVALGDNAKPRRRSQTGGQTSSAVRFRLMGANNHPRMEPEAALPGKVNYFRGGDPRHWLTGVPTFGRIRYGNVYPGIDRVHYGSQGRLEHDFLVAPGADPGQIRIAVEGARRATLTANGDALLETAAGDLIQKRPVIYQETQGRRREIAGEYLLARNELRIRVGEYDRRLPLVIDPIIEYATYVGGSDEEQTVETTENSMGQPVEDPEGYGDQETETAPPYGYGEPMAPGVGTLELPNAGVLYIGGISVDSSGNPVITGSTLSPDFPSDTGVSPFHTHSGALDGFVTKLSADGSAVVFTSFFGGKANDRSNAIALDGADNIFLAGVTFSEDNPLTDSANEGFPTTNNALRPTHLVNAAGDAFVLKLNPAGNALAYSTYLGGNEATSLGKSAKDGANAIAVATDGTAWVTGFTASSNFPTTGNAIQTITHGHADVFVARLNPEALTGPASLLYATYLGGRNAEQGRGIAVDGLGTAYVTGFTGSWDDLTTINLNEGFPVTANAFQSRLRGIRDAFLVKLSDVPNGLLYSTYFGGAGVDRGFGVAVDSMERAYLVGGTDSADNSGTPWNDGLPTTNTALQPTSAGSHDGFLARFKTDGVLPVLQYSTYLGGNQTDQAFAITLAGTVSFVTGATRSTNFPAVFPVQAQTDGIFFDAFVTAIDTFSGSVRYSTYFGGSGGDDVATGIAVDGLGRAHITGRTLSADNVNTPLNEGLPVSPTALQQIRKGASDAFVAAFSAPEALETVKPQCRLIASRPASGPTPAQVDVEVRDTGSGLKRVQVRTASNCTIYIPPFAIGTTTPVVVTASKTNPAQRASFALRVTDAAGNVADCDPVIAEITIPRGSRSVVKTYRNIPEEERYITLENGVPGVDSVRLLVNGRFRDRIQLSAGQKVARDVLTAMRPRKNWIQVTAFGPPGTKVMLVIADAPASSEVSHSPVMSRANGDWGP